MSSTVNSKVIEVLLVVVMVVMEDELLSLRALCSSSELLLVKDKSTSGPGRGLLCEFSDIPACDDSYSFCRFRDGSFGSQLVHSRVLEHVGHCIEVI
jgi:hypothetical protein